MEHSELKKLQEIQLKMLVDFDCFCKKHGLIYFMFYGTLLGAVRHKGFIPWDEDIDTVMTRAEFEKLKELKNELPTHLSISDICYSDIDHAGLVRLIFQDKELGEVHVDIFILDNQRKSWYNGKLMDHFCGLLDIAKQNKNEKQILVRHFKGQPLKQAVIHLSKIVRILVGGSAAAERLLYKLCVSKKYTGHFIVVGVPTSFPAELFQNPQLLSFDGHSFYAPQNVEELLTSMYGNYMEIPPEGHRWLKEEGLE